MLAPAGSLVIVSATPKTARWMETKDLLPPETCTVRVSEAYPALLSVIECWPGVKPGTLYGVIHAASLRPSICTCAPAGVESIANCPGTMTGLAGAARRGFGAYCGFTMTSGSGAGCSAGGSASPGRAAGCWAAGTAACGSAAGWAEQRSS